MSDKLSVPEWTARRRGHEQRVDGLVQAHLERRRHGVTHPVEDFLFTYYSFRPAQLRRWHPGTGYVLDGEPPHARWRSYTRSGRGVTLDPRYVDGRRDTVIWVRDLLQATGSHPVFTGCLGLHEWAMTYRTDEVRHSAWPLRLGRQGTDDVVDAHQIRCTHFDAFRFFTPDAAPRNTVQPSRGRRMELEQPGCLHANMDLYKWAYKLSPLVPSELVADAFELARDIRELDMRASPYDLSAIGYEPVRIETADGKREYAAAQRTFASRASTLRSRLIAGCEQLLTTETPRAPRGAARSPAEPAPTG